MGYILIGASLIFLYYGQIVDVDLLKKGKDKSSVSVAAYQKNNVRGSVYRFLIG
jgi:hypothetical protein